MDGRKELFRGLVGSWNYNLNTQESDKDYKVFIMPTFYDLYDGVQYSKSIIGNDVDLDIHDVRKIPNLWWKANVNFIEVLFSDEITINKDLDVGIKSQLDTIFLLKNNIAKMNLPYLFDACIGMHHNKRGLIDKGTEGTQHLVDMYGYDTKQAMHSLRILDFLVRFRKNGFTDLKKAIWYDNGEPRREFLLKVKGGAYTKEQYFKFADEMLVKANKIKEDYKSQEIDETTNEILKQLIRNIVMLGI